MRKKSNLIYDIALKAAGKDSQLTQKPAYILTAIELPKNATFEEFKAVNQFEPYTENSLSRRDENH